MIGGYRIRESSGPPEIIHQYALRIPVYEERHLGRIKIAKHRIKLLSSSTVPVYSTPYRAVPKYREFEKVKVKNTFAENVIKMAQTK